MLEWRKQGTTLGKGVVVEGEGLDGGSLPDPEHPCGAFWHHMDSYLSAPNLMQNSIYQVLGILVLYYSKRIFPITLMCLVALSQRSRTGL